jgi:hypothetical protein
VELHSPYAFLAWSLSKNRVITYLPLSLLNAKNIFHQNTAFIKEWRKSEFSVLLKN